MLENAHKSLQEAQRINSVIHHLAKEFGTLRSNDLEPVDGYTAAILFETLRDLSHRVTLNLIPVESAISWTLENDDK